MKNSLRASYAALCAALLIVATAAHAAAPIADGAELTLSGAIAVTVENHPEGLASRAEAGAADERIGEAESRLLPQVFGNAQYLRGTSNAIGSTSYLNPGFIPRLTGTAHGAAPNASQSFDGENNYASGLGAYQYLFDYGRVRGEISESSYAAQAEHARLKLTELDLGFATTQAYFGVLAARQLVTVYEKAVAQRQEQLHEAQVKSQAALTPEIDVYTAQAALARSETHLLDARNDAAKAKVALDVAMGLGADAPDYQLVSRLDYHGVTGDLPGYYSAALKSRPDLAMLEDNARAAGARIVEYRSDYLPTVQAAAGYYAMGTGLPAANNYDVGLVITWPIFSGLLTTHQVNEARFHQHAIEEAVEGLRQQIYFQVKSAFLDWQTALQRIHRTEVALQAAQVQLQLADRRYAVGLGNIIELTDAERSYIEDESDRVDALYQYKVAHAALDRAIGQSLEE